MMRISMSLPKKLLEEFDEILRNRGYQSRSKGIRDAIKDYIVRYQWMHEMEGERIGVIAVIYNKEYKGIVEEISDVQHEYRKYINASMHVHLTDKHCLEVLVTKGDVAKIRELTEKLMRLKGVEHVRLTSTSTGKEIDEEV
ncbi:transcriptional regulator, CopG family [Methanothermus fervidus DSM 2088]|uniref:Putative nickel-responsive regulator n=1 Tax=Methanothermus fervidus (strain ATCC 43054 / DSM 2088 / JCM 10308 / V24 S) TaxID=523846 RepID=E3GW80_METFV|nr:nickel-responsive transcriptional regulator NikR [Methanothermus fervidus]ADP77845.1 transcriptional regulator, CopG family [Methanothermus fervidus DSM 2088]